jgi:hypothetical protein
MAPEWVEPAKPAFDGDPRFAQRVEDFGVEQVVAQASVE